MSDFRNFETLLSDGIWRKVSSEHFRDQMCESSCPIFHLENSLSQRPDIGDVKTVTRLHFFLILTADSNSATPKTPESKFSTYGKMHTLRLRYSLDCREGLAHKNKFVCLYACKYFAADFCKLGVIYRVFTNRLLGFRGRGIRIRCQIFEISKHY